MTHPINVINLTCALPVLTCYNVCWEQKVYCCTEILIEYRKGDNEAMRNATKGNWCVTYFFSMPCLSLLISPNRRSKLSQRSRVSLNLVFMLFIWKSQKTEWSETLNLLKDLKAGFVCSAQYLLGRLLLQMNDLILPVNPLRLQLTRQQVRVLQTGRAHSFIISVLI